jgi:hypothetical protein
MATHRYWRITITQSTSGADNLISLYEMEMRGVAGGADLCNGGTPAASHNDATAYKLFDNNNSLYWSNGGPAATCWFEYDFSGGDVEIKQLWFLPRYSSQSPTDFSLSSSDNGSTWNEEAVWSGISGWIGGIGKTIDLPRTVINQQNNRPFTIALTTENRQPSPIGIFVDAALTANFSTPINQTNSQLYPLRLEHQLSLPYSRRVEEQHHRLYGMVLSKAIENSWKRWLLSHSMQPIYHNFTKTRPASWTLRATITSQHSKPFTQTITVARWSSQLTDLMSYNMVAADQHRYWDLSLESGWRQVANPEIRLDGLPVTLSNLVIKTSQDQFGWQAELTMAQDGRWQDINLNSPFTLEVENEHFALIVDEKIAIRDTSGRPTGTVLASSPLAHKAAHPIPLLDQDWQPKVWAREIVEELLGEPVQWQQINWPIATGRLDYEQQSPTAVAKTIVAAAGGVINSQADGSPLVQPRFPIPVPDWQQASPDHIFTDSTDNLEISERSYSQNRFDRITVRETDPNRENGFLSIDLDRRDSGPNRGKTNFLAGETTHLLLTPGPDLEPMTITPSTAAVIPTGEIHYPVSEYLAFVNNDTAKLPQPIEQVDSYTWLGNDLGEPQLAANGQSLTTAIQGTAILHILAMTKSHGYQFKAPRHLKGRDEFPVVFSSWAEDNHSANGAITKQRNGGNQPGADITAPLLSSILALHARGDQELDRGEATGRVEMTTVFRPGLAPGQLIEIHDALYGRTFRGVLTAVRHQIGQNHPVSQLTISKK